MTVSVQTITPWTKRTVFLKKLQKNRQNSLLNFGQQLVVNTMKLPKHTFMKSNMTQDILQRLFFINNHKPSGAVNLRTTLKGSKKMTAFEMFKDKYEQWLKNMTAREWENIKYYAI